MSVKLDLKNALINGDFSYFQRNTSFAAIADNTYAADRWVYSKTGTMVHTVSRSSDVPSSAFGIYSLLSDCTTAQASIGANDCSLISQRIEGNILRSFKNKKVVLSFWVKSTKTGTFCISIRNATDTRSLIKEYTVSASDTWEKKIVRFQHDSFGTWDYTNGIGLKLGFILACGSNLRSTKDSWQNGNFLATADQVNACDAIANDFYLTDVCLQEDNEGQTRVPDFQLAGRDIFEELQLCQRYFEKSYELADAPATITGTAACGSASIGANPSNLYEQITFKVIKRTLPIVTLYNPVTGASGGMRGSTNVTGTATNIGSHGYTASNGASAAGVHTWHFTADAEL